MNTEFKRLGQQPKETKRYVKVTDLSEFVNFSEEGKKQLDKELDEALSTYNRKKSNWLDVPTMKRGAEKSNRKWIGSVKDEVKYYKDTSSMGIKIFKEYYNKTSLTKSLKYRTVAWISYFPTPEAGKYQNYNGTIRNVEVGDIVQIVTPLTVVELTPRMMNYDSYGFTPEYK